MFHLRARSIAFAALSATLLFAANPLAAAETRGIAVQSSDLNLTKGADRAVLQQRIAHAVDRICGSAHARTTADIQAYATCSKAARAGAATQYDSVIAKAQMGMKVAGDRKNGSSAE
jgi:UrcA family protein